jgi:hypothetical protein
VIVLYVIPYEHRKYDLIFSVFAVLILLYVIFAVPIHNMAVLVMEYGPPVVILGMGTIVFRFFGPSHGNADLALIAFPFLGCLMLKRKTPISGYFLRLIYLLMISAILYGFSTYRHPDSRVVLSVIDPNFSGLWMLLFFYYCQKNRYWGGIILSWIAIFFLQSRNYMLSILVFHVVHMWRDQSYTILKRLRMNRFGVCTFVTLIVSGLIGLVYAGNFSVPGYYNPEEGRLFQYDSDVSRFIPYVYFVDSSINDLDKFLFGYGKTYEDTFRADAGTIIHNSFLEIVAIFGVIFASLYFYQIARIVNPVFSRENCAYILSYLFFGGFLHGSLSTFQLLFFLIILSFPQQDGSGKYWRTAMRSTVRQPRLGLV